MSNGSKVLLADPPFRAKQNRDRFLELMGEQGFIASEWQQIQARVWEENDKGYKMVPIEFLALQKAALGDTIGVKFYKD